MKSQKYPANQKANQKGRRGPSETTFVQELIIYGISTAMSCLALALGFKYINPNRRASKKSLYLNLNREENKKEILGRGRSLIQTNSYEIQTNSNEAQFIGTVVEWAVLPTDILVLIAKRIEFYEDFCRFYAVCKSWYSVTSILGKCQNLPTRFPWVMLTDKAEMNFPEVTPNMKDPTLMLIDQVRKNEQIEGMHLRQFYSFSASKSYEFELPEATRKRCVGVGYGLLLTLDYDLQVNILNPFTRQQIGMPNMLAFKNSSCFTYKRTIPQEYILFFFVKVAMSSNPYKPNNQDCIVMVIYGSYDELAFARPGDKVWTNICYARKTRYIEVVFYNGKFYAVDKEGIIDVCDIDEAQESKTTSIACLPSYIYYKGFRKYHRRYRKYLVELSGDLLVVIRFRKGTWYGDKKDRKRPYHHTVGFSIFKLEECDGDNRYKLIEVKNLGNNALFVGSNASVSVPSSRYVKANCIYFSDDEIDANFMQPRGSGYDTGIFDVESGDISLHYASKFRSLLTQPTWIVT